MAMAKHKREKSQKKKEFKAVHVEYCNPETTL